MRSIFNYDGPVVTFLSRMADIIWLNVLFLVCSLPVFTIGASATAMYYVTLKMVRDEESYITKSFFKSFKENFKQATGIWLLIALVSMVLVSDYKIVTSPQYAGIIPSDAVKNVIMVASTAMIILLVCVFVYVFPILAKFENTVKNTIRNAFLMSIRHLPYTVLLVFIHAVPWILMYFSPAMYILILVMFSTVAYFSSKSLVKIFDYYIPKDSNETLEEGKNEEA